MTPRTESNALSLSKDCCWCADPPPQPITHAQFMEGSEVFDLHDLQLCLPGRKLEGYTLSEARVEKCASNRRLPTHPVPVEIGLVHADEAIGGCFTSALFNGHGRAKLHAIANSQSQRYHFRRPQAFLQIGKALVQCLKFALGLAISLRDRKQGRALFS